LQLRFLWTAVAIATAELHFPAARQTTSSIPISSIKIQGEKKEKEKVLSQQTKKKAPILITSSWSQ
jgi:hypothetical protein